MALLSVCLILVSLEAMFSLDALEEMLIQAGADVTTSSNQPSPNRLPLI